MKPCFGKVKWRLDQANVGSRGYVAADCRLTECNYTSCSALLSSSILDRKHNTRPNSTTPQQCATANDPWHWQGGKGLVAWISYCCWWSWGDELRWWLHAHVHTQKHTHMQEIFPYNLSLRSAWFKVHIGVKTLTQWPGSPSFTVVFICVCGH